MSKPTPKPFAFTRREVLEEIAQLSGGRCLLAFSRGKDSIAAWLELGESGLFPEIVPFHLDGCPGMSFVEGSLRYTGINKLAIGRKRVTQAPKQAPGKAPKLDDSSQQEIGEIGLMF